MILSKGKQVLTKKTLSTIRGPIMPGAEGIIRDWDDMGSIYVAFLQPFACYLDCRNEDIIEKYPEHNDILKGLL